MKTTNRFFCLLFLLIVMLSSCVWISAAPRVLWRIGKFDHSSMEFNQGSVGPPLFGLGYPKNPIVYIVGQSNPKKTGPRFSRERRTAWRDIILTPTPSGSISTNLSK